MATLLDLTIPVDSYIDLYATASISTSQVLVVQNKGSTPLYVVISSAQPSTGSKVGYQIGPNDPPQQIVLSGSNKCWVCAGVNQGTLNVQSPDSGSYGVFPAMFVGTSNNTPIPILDAYQAPTSTNWTSATAVNTAWTVNSAGYDTIIVTIAPPAGLTAGVAIFEAYDGYNWINIKAPRTDSYLTDGSFVMSGSPGTHSWQVPVAGYPQFRVRLSTAIVGAGTTTVTTIASSAPDTSLVTVGFDPQSQLPYQKSAVIGGTYYSALNTDLLTGTVNGYVDTQANGNAGWNSVFFQYNTNGSYAGGGVALEMSADAVTWSPLAAQQIGNTNPSLLTGFSTGANTTVTCYAPVYTRYIRARIGTAPTAGAVAMLATFSQSPYQPLPGYSANGQQPYVNCAQVGGTNWGSIYSSMTWKTAAAMAFFGGVPYVDRPSAALTTSGNSGVIGDEFNASGAFAIVVTAVSGTTPTLDIVLQETYDGGTTFTDVYHVPRISTTGTWTIPHIQLGGRRRWVYTVNGTTPSFTFSITRAMNNGSPIIARNFYDRTAGLLSPNASLYTTQTFDVSGLKSITVSAFTTGAAATAGCTLALQFSNDQVNFVTAASTIAVPAATGGYAFGTFPATAITGRFCKVVVSAAGTGQTLSLVNIYGTN